jgi:voltage-gated potassium channel
MSLTNFISRWQAPISLHLLPVGPTSPKPTRIRRFLIRYRFTVLLIFIVMLLSVLPFIKGEHAILLKLVVSLILLFGIFAGHQMRGALTLGSVLAIPAVAGRALPRYATHIGVSIAIDILTALFLLYVTIMILYQVLNARRVTLDTIAGALCTYFLIGLAGAFVYRTTFVIDPNSFRTAPGGSAPIFENDSPMRPKLMHFIYYSFTALTTTGFGDITPTSGPSRAMSLLEAIAGQFFLAVLIARLVSLELIHSNRRDREIS